MKQIVKIQKLSELAVIPAYQTAHSAGADLYAALESPVIIPPGQTCFIPTGLAMEIPEGLVGLIYARSGLACKKGIAPANKVGVIDPDYRGEILIALHNHSMQDSVEIQPGERVAQFVLTPYITADFEESGELCASERGAGGFGSTGNI